MPLSLNKKSSSADAKIAFEIVVDKIDDENIFSTRARQQDEGLCSRDDTDKELDKAILLFQNDPDEKNCQLFVNSDFIGHFIFCAAGF